MVILILEVTRRTTDSAGTVESLWTGEFEVRDLQLVLALHDTAVAAGASEARVYARNAGGQHLAIKSKLDFDRNQKQQSDQPRGILIPVGNFDGRPLG